jgi:hypothetical protein
MEVFLPSSSFGASSYRLLLSPLAVQILGLIGVPFHLRLHVSRLQVDQLLEVLSNCTAANGGTLMRLCVSFPTPPRVRRLSAFSQQTGVSTCAINCTSGIDEVLNPVRD